MVRALLALTGSCLAAASLPTSVEIAPGVHMPFANMGGSDGSYSNYSLWLELGGRALDTALSYVQGDVQPQVGEAIRSSGIPRSELFVTTKIPCCPSAGGYFDTYYCNDHPRDAPTPDEDVDATLAAIGIEYADLILLHWPCEKPEDTVATYKGLERAVASGKARAIGVSNFNATALESLVSAVDVKPAFNMCGFSVGHHNASETLLGQDDVTTARCAEKNITYGAYSPLHGDALKSDTVVSIANKHNRSTAEIALRWIVQQGHTFTSASMKESYDMEDLAATTFTLTDDEMDRLSAATSVVEALV